MIVPSENAVDKLIEILVSKCADIGLGFRLHGNVKEHEEKCYNLRLDSQHPQDEVVVVQGIKIFLDPADSILLDDYKLDYIDQPDTLYGEFLLIKSNGN